MSVFAQAGAERSSTLNGDTNLSFYKAVKAAGFDADTLPIMALLVSEAEL